MLKITNTKVVGLEESIIASGYPKRDDFPIDIDREKASTLENEFNTISEKSPHYIRMKKLGAAPSNSGHSNALTGIIVQFDVTYPQYWSMQFQRYHFIQIISSQSKMHMLHKMNLTENVNEYITKETLEHINKLQFEYSINPTYINYMRLLSNCPMGLELTMRVSTNYLQLLNIYNQRKTHRLEEWKIFCDWILTLPYFKELTGI